MIELSGSAYIYEQRFVTQCEYGLVFINQRDLVHLDHQIASMQYDACDATTTKSY